MRLYGTPTSPFVRKVRAAAHLFGLDHRITFVPIDLAKPASAFDTIAVLGKVPVLVEAHGQVLIESSLICLHLEALAEQPTLTAEPDRLALLALADGVLEAGVALRKEGRRPPSLVSADVVAAETQRLRRGLDVLEARADDLGAERDIATVASACVLDWLSFRFPEPDPLAGRPRLTAALAVCAAEPWFRLTDPRRRASPQ